VSSVHRFGAIRVRSIFKGTKSSVRISLITIFRLCRDGVVCIATRYMPGPFGVRILVKARIFVPFKTGRGAQSASHAMSSGTVSWG
jgi:hypothetical protein